MFCWGSHNHGVLGLGSGIKESQFFPIKVIIDECSPENQDLLEVVEISSGKNHVGAICRKKTNSNGDSSN